MKIPKFLKYELIYILNFSKSIFSKYHISIHCKIEKNMRAQGFEPWTNRSGAERSAAELYPHLTACMIVSYKKCC